MGDSHYGWDWQNRTWMQLLQYKRLHIIMLYGFKRAAPEPPLFGTDQRDCSPPLLQRSLPTGTVWTRRPLSFHRKHNLNTRFWGRGGSDNGRADLPWHNKSLAPHFSGSPVCHYRHHSSPLSFSFVLSFTVSFSSLSSIGHCKWRRASGSDKSVLMRASLLTRCHSLMSWDSNIFARVFFTLRAVRREAGLWAQHSDISFPICRRHWRHRCKYTSVYNKTVYKWFTSCGQL